jgi:hypothetical protein
VLKMEALAQTIGRLQSGKKLLKLLEGRKENNSDLPDAIRAVVEEAALGNIVLHARAAC